MDLENVYNCINYLHIVFISFLIIYFISIYIIIRVHSAFSLVVSCVLLKYTRTDDVN